MIEKYQQPTPETISPEDYYPQTSKKFDELSENLRVARLTGNETLEQEIEEQTYNLSFEVHQYTGVVVTRLQTLLKGEKDEHTRKNYQAVIAHYTSIADRLATEMNDLTRSKRN